MYGNLRPGKDEDSCGQDGSAHRSGMCRRNRYLRAIIMISRPGRREDTRLSDEMVGQCQGDEVAVGARGDR